MTGIDQIREGAIGGPVGRSGLNRRDLLLRGTACGLTALGGTLLWSGGPAFAQGTSTAMDLVAGKLALRPKAPDSVTPLCEPPFAGKFPSGGTARLKLHNALVGAVTMRLRGAGAAASHSTARIDPGAEDTIRLRPPHAGTMLAEFALPGTHDSLCAAALVVAEPSPPRTDQDSIMLIEEWRVRGDGTLAVAGAPDGDAARVFTVNRALTPEIKVRRNERLRLRCINASQRSVVAIRIDHHDLRVMAVDSRPAEPFLARNGQIVLAPGGRIDAFVDATGEPSSTAAILLHDGDAARTIATLAYDAEARRPGTLPDPGPLAGTDPPAQPDLAKAQRTEIVFDGSTSDNAWALPHELAKTPPPNAFTVKRGTTVSLALVNHSRKPVIIHLRGHHARLLDRLDDGWKPYWVDTIPIDTGATARIAFVPENEGSFVIEGFAPEWDAPLLLRSYAVV